jgi:hypothetical protein
MHTATVVQQLHAKCRSAACPGSIRRRDGRAIRATDIRSFRRGDLSGILLMAGRG